MERRSDTIRSRADRPAAELARRADCGILLDVNNVYVMRDLAAIQRRFYELVTAGEGAIDPGLLGGSRRLDIYAEM